MNRDKADSAFESEDEHEVTTSSASSRSIFVRKEDLDPNRVDKDILIVPYKAENFQGTSYFLTLGTHYFVHETMTTLINPESKKSVRNYWGQPKKAVKLPEIEIRNTGLDSEKKYIKIAAGKTILCHTSEFIGISEGMQILFKPVSRLVISLLDVKITTGGNYFDRCILIIKNSSESCVYLNEGTFISEVTFFRTSQPKDGNELGKDKMALSQIQKNWKPENLFVSNISGK